MARPKKPTPESNCGELTVAGQAQFTAEQQIVARHAEWAQQIEARFGNGQPFDLESAVEHLATLRSRISTALFEMGALCLRLKANLPGQFCATLEKVGIDPQCAQRAMRAVLKYSQSDAKQALIGQVTNSKLLELVVLDDDTLEQIAEGDFTDLHLDDIQRMGIQELRKRVRDLRTRLDEEDQVRDKLVAHRDSTIRSLESELLRVRNLAAKSTHRERAEDFLTLLDRHVMEHMELIFKMETLHSEVLALYVEAGERIDADISVRLDQVATAVGERIRPYMAQAGV